MCTIVRKNVYDLIKQAIQTVLQLLTRWKTSTNNTNCYHQKPNRNILNRLIFLLPSEQYYLNRFNITGIIKQIVKKNIFHQLYNKQQQYKL